MVSILILDVCAGLRGANIANIEDSTPPEKQPSVVHTIVRPLGKLPAGFEAKVRAEKAPVKPMVNEKMLLNNLLGVYLISSDSKVH